MARLAIIFARVNEKLGVWFVRVVLVSVLLSLFFVTGGGISQNDRWKINDIKISGANVVSNDQIMTLVREKLLGNYYFVYSKDNSYLFPRHEIEATMLETFPRLSSVLVRRQGDHTIAIWVTERTPFALWCGKIFAFAPPEITDCYFVDETGFVFDHAPIFSEGVYFEIYGGIEGLQNDDVLRASITPERFMLVRAFESLLKKEIADPLRVMIKPDGEYGVTVRSSIMYPVLNGIEIRFKDGQDPDALVHNLSVALPIQFPSGPPPKKKLQYIDMRFNNKVVFGFTP